jgi:hydrogenase small subunit
MIISRRQFLKYCSIAAGAIGLTTTDLMKLEKTLAYNPGGVPVVWINGQACTGCTVSLANSVYYQTIQELALTGEPSQTIQLKYSETLSAAMSTEATLQSGLTDFPFVLAIEGAIPTGPTVGTSDTGMYCQAGDFGGGTEAVADTIWSLSQLSACAAVLNIGTCSSFGGIPAANGNVTNAKGFLDFIEYKTGSVTDSAYRTTRAKTVNIPGCPPNPNWIVGTIAYILSRRTEWLPVKLPSIDSLRRPRLYYGERQCNYCERFQNSLDTDDFFVGVNPDRIYNRLSVNEPQMIGSPVQNLPSGATARCLKLAGCKGSRTKGDCSWRKWHSPAYLQTGINWCVGAGAPCQGCTQNFFPDRMSPFHYIR